MAKKVKSGYSELELMGDSIANKLGEINLKKKNDRIKLAKFVSNQMSQYANYRIKTLCDKVIKELRKNGHTRIKT